MSESKPIISLSEASLFLRAKMIGKNATFQGVSTDTRTLEAGSLFVAISGEHFEGHDFINEAEQKGAACVMVSRPVKTALPVCEVLDTREGLLQLALFWRRRFEIPVIGVTGSCGKTTVKEMIASILATSLRGEAKDTGDSVLRSQGNFNNEIGVPLTLFRLQEKHRFAVIEMGASKPGDIARLTAVVSPTVAVITNVAPAHLQGFLNCEGVASAKAEIFRGLDAGGIAILNADDPFIDTWRRECGAYRVITFGERADADVQALHSTLDSKGCAEFKLSVYGKTVDVKCSLPGWHQVSNVLTSVAAAAPFQVSLDSIQEALLHMKPIPGRMVFCKGIDGARVIDDTYNANVASVRAAIQTVAAYEGDKLLVLGDLAELGEASKVLHEALGEEAKAQGFAQLFTVGFDSQWASRKFGQGGEHFENLEQLIGHLRTQLSPQTTVLVKGSRRAHMEQVVKAICQEQENTSCCFG
ncbi:MAG: UDP-N-acetylmuramoyl-tripeptide--D-alanyl-D-alanine ligase [Gammaproteobacteria bacterium]|nr:UDP-N-acetylmuramoyl-tripeptide--D-alanyl-D-alanine ligase [Gammaproteobacteria bacterium]